MLVYDTKHVGVTIIIKNQRVPFQGLSNVQNVTFNFGLIVLKFHQIESLNNVIQDILNQKIILSAVVIL